MDSLILILGNVSHFHLIKKKKKNVNESTYLSKESDSTHKFVIK